MNLKTELIIEVTNGCFIPFFGSFVKKAGCSLITPGLVLQSVLEDDT